MAKSKLTLEQIIEVREAAFLFKAADLRFRRLRHVYLPIGTRVSVVGRWTGKVVTYVADSDLVCVEPEDPAVAAENLWPLKPGHTFHSVSVEHLQPVID